MTNIKHNDNNDKHQITMTTTTDIKQLLNNTPGTSFIWLLFVEAMRTFRSVQASRTGALRLKLVDWLFVVGVVGVVVIVVIVIFIVIVIIVVIVIVMMVVIVLIAVYMTVSRLLVCYFKKKAIGDNFCLCYKNSSYDHCGCNNHCNQRQQTNNNNNNRLL